jgi:hypothetical protein
VFAVIFMLPLTVATIASANTIQTKKTPEAEQIKLAVVIEKPRLYSYEEEYYMALIPSKLSLFTLEMCRKYDVPISIVYGLGMRESQWNINCRDNVNRNGSHDIGLFQLNSRYVGEYSWKFYDKKIGKDQEFNPRNPKHNIQVAVRILANLYDQFDGAWTFALIAYNRGAQALIERKVTVKDPLVRAYVDEIYSYQSYGKPGI